MLPISLLKLLAVLILTIIIYNLIDAVSRKGIVDFVDSIAWLLSLIAATLIVQMLTENKDR
ncbi:hypothetical protein J31TS6_47970 [Brevibacillus reuszeri]|nr:hypothetical protein J31TS6_47970 [Brevibacillus reuszeri]